jgi:hypothetical protein
MCRKAVRAEDDEYKTQNQTYYNIAHSSHEKIMDQPSLLIGGSLKEYQVFCNSLFAFCTINWIMSNMQGTWPYLCDTHY